MQRPDLPTRVAHALRPEVRARQEADQRRIEAVLIGNSRGELLTRLKELQLAERMLRELSVKCGYLQETPDHAP